MSTLTDIRKLIYKRFVTQWGDASIYTFDNEDFKPSRDQWVRLSVRNNSSVQETLGTTGNRSYLRKGSIYIQIFSKIGTGVKESDLLCDLARTIFEGVTFNDIRCYDAFVREGIDDVPWKQTIAEIQFEYNQTK